MSGPSNELYRKDHTAIGTWFCRPSDPEFGGGWMEQPTVVFPRTCVRITQEGEDTILTDANMAVLYRGSQTYTRDLVDPVGDRCDWFEFDVELAGEIVRNIDCRSDDTTPITRTQAPTSPQAFMLQPNPTLILCSSRSQ